MNESVNNSVSNFSQHLVLIEEQLESDPHNESLLSLKNDILKFIQIARAQTDVLTSNSHLPSDSSPLISTSDPQLVIGDKCSIPYNCYTGGVVSMNCVVMELDYGSNSALVLFTHPTGASMVPCQHFLEGSCKFGDECRYSHGYKVDIRMIGPYQESDVSQVKPDSSCIVYSEEEKIWNPGVILQMFEEKCEVCVGAEKIVVPIQDIFILQDEHDVDSYSSGEESDVEIRTIPVLPSREDESNSKEVCTVSEASWEKHTRGIGSKLMSKMGYVAGTGLGADSHGRREPVEIVVLPKGRSLDKCMELKNKVTNNNTYIAKKKSMTNIERIKKIHLDRSTDSMNLDVFEFLNDSMELQQLVHDERTVRDSVTNREKKSMDTSQSRRIHLDKLVRDGRAEVDRLKKSLARNKKDPVVAKQIEIKLKRAVRDLSQLEREESSILDKLSSKKKRANMSVF